MAHKKFGRWFCNDRFFSQVKIANELWFYGRMDDTEEKQFHLFFIGWYQRPGGWKLYTCCFLFVSIQIGLPW